jgi:hypothetical protein
MKAFQAEAQKFFPVRAIYKMKRELEKLVSETYLNISVLGNEFDESLEAIQKVACKTKQNLDDFVFFTGLLQLSFVIFKDYSDELNQGYQESSESDGSKMVSEDPVETFAEGAFSVGVT